MLNWDDSSATATAAAGAPPQATQVVPEDGSGDSATRLRRLNVAHTPSAQFQSWQDGAAPRNSDEKKFKGTGSPAYIPTARKTAGNILEWTDSASAMVPPHQPHMVYRQAQLQAQTQQNAINPDVPPRSHRKGAPHFIPQAETTVNPVLLGQEPAPFTPTRPASSRMATLDSYGELSAKIHSANKKHFMVPDSFATVVQNTTESPFVPPVPQPPPSTLHLPATHSLSVSSIYTEAPDSHKAQISLREFQARQEREREAEAERRQQHRPAGPTTSSGVAFNILDGDKGPLDPATDIPRHGRKHVGPRDNGIFF